MITRHATPDGIPSSAIYSDCETYRYALTRVWDDSLPHLLYVMLNPSKATEAQNDPTIERCQRRATQLGFGGFCATNIFALRETDPMAMRRHPAPEGPDNSAIVLREAAAADLILCAWGTHGAHLNQGPSLEAQLRAAGHELHALGLSKDGHPRHPLYVRYAAQPELWQPSAR